MFQGEWVCKLEWLCSIPFLVDMLWNMKLNTSSDMRAYQYLEGGMADSAPAHDSLIRGLL